MIRRLLLLLLVFPLFLQAQTLRVPYRDGNKWGYADTAARVLITPRWTSAHWFSIGDGMAVVSQKIADKERFGAIDTTGKERVRPQFAALRPEPGENERNQYLGHRFFRNRRPEPRDTFGLYDSIRFYFSNCYFVAKNDAGKWGLVDKNNRITIPFEYDSLAYVAIDNRVPAYRARKNGGKWGMIDATGSVRAPFEFTKIETDRWGAGRIHFERNGELDEEGTSVVSAPMEMTTDPVSPVPLQSSELSKADSVIPAFEGRFADVAPQFRLVRIKGRWGVADKAGKMIIAPQYVYLKGYRLRSTAEEVLFLASEKRGKYGLINTKGQTILPFEYDTIMRSSDYVNGWKDVHYLKQDGRWGLANEGALKVPPRYEDLGYIMETTERGDSFQVAVKQNGLWGVVDQSGNFVMPATEKGEPQKSYLFRGRHIILTDGGLRGIYFVGHPERTLLPKYHYRGDMPQSFYNGNRVYHYLWIGEVDGSGFWISDSGVRFIAQNR